MSKANGKPNLQRMFSKLSVTTRIVILCVVPAAGLLFASGQQMLAKYEKVTEAHFVLNLAEKVPSISEVVHELQKERGMSAGFIGSNGVKFANDLPQQRGLTDQAIQVFESQFDEAGVAVMGPGLAEHIGHARKALVDLQATRAKVTALELKTPQMAGNYTNTISELLDVVAATIHVVEDPETVRTLVAMDALLQGKERAGIERAVGTAAFASNTIDQANYLKFNSLVGVEDIKFEAFKAFAPDELVSLYDATVTGPVVEHVETLRKVLQGAPFGGSLTSVTGDEWFDATTARIDLLKQVEDASNKNLVAFAKGQEAAITQALRVAALISGALIAFTAVMAFFVIRSVSGPVVKLTNTMRTLAEGEYDIDVDGTDNYDQLGDMARAVEVFRENGKKVASMTAAEVAADQRRRAERAEMMQDLQRAFGEVVDAAIAGDFSRRVESEFPDAELNNLAAGVNNLVETVDRGMSETGEVLAALADTDLTQRVNGEYQGAFLKLKEDTNAVADNLTKIVGQLRQTSGGLKIATGEILAGANDLSERTTRQAATIEETSAAMEQLSITVVDNAKKAEAATEKTQYASRLASEGGEVMGDATLAMERITTSSSKISNIIGMIDDIAFQTNLLALNASVEAARAGEAGKGFAVVAVEVRRLAQSAAEASSEVKVLIEQSAEEVSGGSKLVAEASEKLTAMLAAVKENSDLMTAISSASREQASAIEEVGSAVRQMDEMTQHNAALVEETNAAIEQTEAQASELDRIVDVFRIAESGARKPASAEPAAAPKGIKALQQKVVKAAKSYLSNGNAAVKEEWSEF